MIGSPQASSLVHTTKNFITQQTWSGFALKFPVGVAFVPGVGVGQGVAANAAVVCLTGGCPDQQVTAVMRYTAPSTALNANFGILMRLNSLDGGNNFYAVTVNAGIAYLFKVVAGVTTVLHALAFPLPVDTDVTITASAIGTSLAATLTAAGPGTINLNAVDGTFANGGTGMIAFVSTFYCSSFDVQQLQ